MTEHDPSNAAVARRAIAAVRPYLGWILIAAGAVLVIIGYLGISNEALVAKQLPYLISGGIGGLVLAILGSYFLATEELQRDSGRLDRVEKMVNELHTVLLDRPDAPAAALASVPEKKRVSGAARAESTSVVAVAGGEMYHEADCDLARGKQLRTRTLKAATAAGLRACPVCLGTSAT